MLNIAENVASVIRRAVYGGNVVHESTPGIVSCDEMRPFWIRWIQGVEVGEGMVVGAGTFMVLSDEQPKQVVAVGLSTGWNNVGEWKISNIGGD